METMVVQILGTFPLYEHFPYLKTLDDADLNKLPAELMDFIFKGIQQKPLKVVEVESRIDGDLDLFIDETKKVIRPLFIIAMKNGAKIPLFFEIEGGETVSNNDSAIYVVFPRMVVSKQ